VAECGLGRTVVAVVSTWVAGVVIDSPNHLGWSSHRFDTKIHKCLWDRSTSRHYVILFIVVGMLLPFIVTFICYWRIFVHIQLAKRRLLRIHIQVIKRPNKQVKSQNPLYPQFQSINHATCQFKETNRRRGHRS